MGQHILIRTPNHLGDCIMALPMINETREAYPGATVSILTPEPMAELFHQNPAVDHIVTIPPRHIHGMMAVVKIRELIAQGSYDIGYILPPSFGAAAGFKLAGVPERIGYIADGRRLLLTRPLPLPVPLNSEHRSEVYFNLLRRGAGRDLTYVYPKLFLNESDITRAREMLESFGVADGEDYIAVACRAVAESRRWGAENYAALVKIAVEEMKLKVVLIGSDDDRPTAAGVASGHAETTVVNLAGRTSLRETAAVLSRAACFVGNDSGPAHLAAAVGAPVVVLSGADDPKETTPLSRRKELIYLEHLDCISCVKNKCPLTGEKQMACMKGISVAMVAERVRTVLGRGAPSEPASR
ncbi:MAG: lipopolysaccharide heptosyltransferase II [candidate division Zixibacteria bacterium]|jgi:lipopolysaccharide heptosyltransferase II|nr:lipopolysaccharide heptosyltransferase II [candidate division Zixibacteria bacterium]